MQQHLDFISARVALKQIEHGIVTKIASRHESSRLSERCAHAEKDRCMRPHAPAGICLPRKTSFEANNNCITG